MCYLFVWVLVSNTERSNCPYSSKPSTLLMTTKKANTYIRTVKMSFTKMKISGIHKSHGYELGMIRNNLGKRLFLDTRQGTLVSFWEKKPRHETMPTHSWGLVSTCSTKTHLLFNPGSDDCFVTLSDRLGLGNAMSERRCAEMNDESVEQRLRYEVTLVATLLGVSRK